MNLFNSNISSMALNIGLGKPFSSVSTQMWPYQGAYQQKSPPSAHNSLDALFTGLYAYLMRCPDVPSELLDTLEEVVLGEKLDPLTRAAKRAKLNHDRAARLAAP